MMNVFCGHLSPLWHIYNLISISKCQAIGKKRKKKFVIGPPLRDELEISAQEPGPYTFGYDVLVSSVWLLLFFASMFSLLMN